MVEAAGNLRIADLLSLSPGQVLRLHRVNDRPILFSSSGPAPNDRELAQLMTGSNRGFPAENLQGILDCAVETQVVIRRERGKILQFFSLDPRSWRHLLEQQGVRVELRIGGRIFAHGTVVGGDEPGIRISSLVERRP